MSDQYGEEFTPDQLATVVELQRVEINRLLREHERLNDRIDRLLQLQEREQVLRQQTQAALDSLAERHRLLIERSDGQGNADMSARLQRTERKFAALQDRVGQLVDLIERKREPDGYVRVFAPGV